MFLDATTKSIQVLLEGAITTTEPVWSTSYGDVNSTTEALSALISTDGATNGATPVTVIAAPAAGSVRVVKELVFYNADSVGHTFTVRLNDSSTIRNLVSIGVAALSTLRYSPETGWQNGTTAGAGTVTSVGLTMPAEYLVSGTPITTAGTLSVTKAAQPANVVMAGPTTGSPATPTFRALVAADIPGAIGGTVTSVGLALPAELTVSGSPVTTAGTLAAAWANEAANLVFAGPASAGPATPGFRGLVAADIPSLSASYLRLDGSNSPMTGALGLAVGSAALPSAYFAGFPGTGFFYDTVNAGIAMSAGGAEFGTLSAVGLQISIPGGGPAVSSVYGEGNIVLSQLIRLSNNNASAAFVLAKGRGTIASPAIAVLNDVLGQINISPVTANGYPFTATPGIIVKGTLIETGTVSPTSVGSRLSGLICAIGSGATTEVFRFETLTGFSMYGANPVIDQNRTLIPNSSTVAGLPAVVTGGLRYVTDLNGGSGVVFGGVSNWRDINDLQVAQNTIDGSGVLSKFTGHCSFAYRAILNNTMQKLSDAGLLSGKLLGLWVHAVPTNSTDGLLNWITPGTRNAAIIGSPTWTANQGFTGDNATALISTVANQTAFGGAQDNFAIGVYVRTAGSSAKAVIGQNNVGSARQYYLQTNTSGALIARLMDVTNDNYTPAKYAGLFILSRGAAANYQASNDDATATTITRTSTAIANRIIAFLGTADTTASEFTDAQISFSFLATALSPTDIANLRAIMVDYYLAQVGAITATVNNLPPAANFTGQTYYVPDLGGGASLIQADAANWFRNGFNGYEARSLATGSETITYLTNAGNVEYTANLTGNVTVTLGATDAKGSTPKKGAEFWITLDQAAPGAFTFAIKDGVSTNTLVTFGSATNKSAGFMFSGTNWRLKQDSAL